MRGSSFCESAAPPKAQRRTLVIFKCDMVMLLIRSLPSRVKKHRKKKTPTQLPDSLNCLSSGFRRSERDRNGNATRNRNPASKRIVSISRHSKRKHETGDPVVRARRGNFRNHSDISITKRSCRLSGSHFERSRFAAQLFFRVSANKNRKHEVNLNPDKSILQARLLQLRSQLCHNVSSVPILFLFSPTTLLFLSPKKTLLTRTP